MSADRLIVRGAREHNLKNVSLDLPRNAISSSLDSLVQESHLWLSTQSSLKDRDGMSNRSQHTRGSF